MSSYDKAYLEEKLSRELETEHIEVTDISGGCGSSFKVLVVSKQFEGKNRIACHRLVNELLKEELKVIHALTLTTKTPAQWAEMQKQQ